MDRAAFNRSCSALAKSILDRNPSSSRTLAAKLVFTDALTTADYAAAQQSAPYEPWPLGTRLLVLERNAPLSADLLPIAEADIAAAFVSSWGRELLAGIYIRKEPLRPLILKVAETRPRRATSFPSDDPQAGAHRWLRQSATRAGSAG
ncbi:hypothetical protein ACFSHQ_06960 [Gemmobacter lanyuensis]